ncbi:GntR family transcriptional regulator, partial [Micrococcus sp. HSID17228]
AELQVSRNSLREAFTMLASEGLVERRPHRGVFVAAPGPQDVRGLYRTRRVIQLGALEHGELTPGAARHLRCAQDLLSGGPDTPARVLGDANHRVHVGIVDLAGAPELTRLMASVQARVRLAFHPMDEQTRLHVLFADRNRWIVERLLAGDLPAVHAMFGGYLDEAEQFVLAHLAAVGG